MRSEQLNYLLEVSQSKSISEASARLNMTPQALSIALNNLEEELGFALLVKTNQGSSLTKAGKEFAKVARRYLYDVDQLKTRYGLTRPKRQFTIEATYGGGFNFLPQLKCSLYKTFPEADVTLVEKSYEEILADIRQAKVEFALFDHVVIQGRVERSFDEDMEFTTLFQYDLVSLVPNEFPIAKQKTISIKELIKYPVILLCMEDARRISAASIVEAFGQPKKLIIEHDWNTSNKLVEAGLGSKLELEMPFGQERFKSNDAYSRIPISSDVQIFCGCLMKRGQALSEGAQLLLGHIRQMARQ